MADVTSTFRAVADFSAIKRESREAIVALELLRKESERVTRTQAGGFAKVAVAQKAMTATTKTNTGALTANAVATAASGKSARSAGSGFSLLNREMGRATARAGQMQGGLIGVVAQLGAAKSAALGFAATLGTFAAVGAVVGIKFNAQLEQLEIGFESILGSATAAKDVIEDIIDFARVTPFDTAGLANQVQQMVAAGFSLEETLVKADGAWDGLLVTIGDAAAAMGGGREVADGLIRAITRIRATGRVTFEELRLFMERGIPVLDILKDKLGLTDDEVRNIADSGIAAGTAIDAIAEGLDERFGGAMEKQARTMNGLLSTLKDNVLIGFGQAFEGLFGAAKDQLESFTDALTEFTTRVGSVGFMEALEEQSSLAAKSLSALGEAFSGLGDVMSALKPALQGFVEALALIVSITIVPTLVAIGKTLSVIAFAINSVNPDILKMVGAFVAFRMATKKAEPALNALLRQVTKLGGKSINVNSAIGKFGKSLRLLGPHATGIAIGLTAVSAAIVLVARNATKAERQWVTMSESAAILSGATDDLSASIVADTGEIDKNSATWLEWLESTKDIRNRLKDIGSIQLQLEAIEAFGVSMLINGDDPEIVLTTIQSLIDNVVGEDHRIEFDADEQKLIDVLGGAQALLDRFATEVADIDIASAIGTNLGTGQEFFDTTSDAGVQLKDTLTDIATEMSKVALGGDTAGAIQGMSDLNDAVVGLGLGVHGTDQVLNLLNDEFNKGIGLSSKFGANMTTLPDVFDAATSAESDLDEKQKDMLKSTQRLIEVQGKDLPTALELVESAAEAAGNEFDGLAGKIANAEKNADAAAEAFGERLVENAKSAQKALADFSDPVDVFTTLMGEVTDEGKELAEEAARAVGLSADQWQMFPEEAGVGLDDFANRLKANRLTQEEWERDVTAIGEVFGKDVAKFFLDAGPEMAGAAREMLEDTTGAAQDVADEIKEDAERGTDDYATEFVLGLEQAAKDITDTFGDASPDIRRQAQKWENSASEPLERAAERIEVAMRNIAIALGRPLPTPRVPDLGGVHIPGGGVLAADGGITSFGSGGFRDGFGPLPEQARIQRTGPLIQWAEPETGGEAFIPLAASKRRQSVDIWRRTGQLLGAISFEHGGFSHRQGSGVLETGTLSSAEINRQQAELGRTNFGGSTSSGSSGSSGGSGLSAEIEKANDEAEELADTLKEIRRNTREWKFEQKSIPGQIRTINRRLAKTVEFTDEWMDLMRQREGLFDELRAGIDDQARTLNDLLDQEIDLRAALVDRQTDFETDIADAEEDLADRISDINENLADRIGDITERRDDARADAAEQLAETLEDIAESRAEAIVDAEERLADRREEIAERTADALEDNEERLRDALAQRAEALASSLDPLQRVERAWANTTAAILANFTEQNAQFDATATGILQLQSLGLSMQAIELLGLDQGPAALTQIEELAGASSAEIEELNRLAAQRLAASDTIITATSADLFEAAADSRAQILADAAEAEADLLEDFSRTMADIGERADRAAADAQERFNRTIADANEAFTEGIEDANAAAAEARGDAMEAFDETVTDIRARFEEDMEDLRQQLATLGEDQGRTWAEAIAAGLASGIPAIVAMAEGLEAEIRRLERLAADVVNSPRLFRNGVIAPPLPTESEIQGFRELAQSSSQSLLDQGLVTAEQLGLPPGTTVVPLSMHRGGLVTGEGGTGNGEVLRLLQTGEGVMSRKAIAAIRGQGGIPATSELSRAVSELATTASAGGSDHNLAVKLVTPDGRVMWDFMTTYRDEDEILEGVMRSG